MLIQSIIIMGRKNRKIDIQWEETMRFISFKGQEGKSFSFIDGSQQAERIDFGENRMSG